MVAVDLLSGHDDAGVFQQRVEPFDHQAVLDQVIDLVAHGHVLGHQIQFVGLVGQNTDQRNDGDEQQEKNNGAGDQ